MHYTISRAVQVRRIGTCKPTGAHLSIGVATDISHINTKSTVTGYEPTPSGLKAALKGAEIVLIPAGVPRKPGMTRDGILNCPTMDMETADWKVDLFNTNASIVRDLAKAVADAAPNAKILVISNPVRQCNVLQKNI